ncbi:hypothetical protein [Streptomyces fractus]|uniref:hypothetical protein n=1 Tax=Streptomyces fractus TaxID=641806 RepID=UPI003CF0207B
MKLRVKQRLVLMGAYSDPPKQLTVREIAVNVVIAGVVFGAMGLVIGDWQMVISVGMSSTGGHLIHQWWWRRTGQPEAEDGQ